MAFFGLTLLGYQNTIKEYLREDGTPKAEVKLPLIPVDQTSRYTGHKNSYNEMRRLSILNTRPILGPREVYRIPLTTSHEYGFFIDMPGDKWERRPTKNK
ncbi:hypothetical protein CSKR_110330 [Clonorchis sinensis]|uniref:Uncharacterized protein n=1 Tax=Clonorchis sinensis TaxID=79923 RepID=A0A3R7H9Z6_CLOSI|nr:hypothetical protein CSKR_110330 [Clonorchis sinensis]